MTTTTRTHSAAVTAMIAYLDQMTDDGEVPIETLHAAEDALEAALPWAQTGQCFGSSDINLEGAPRSAAEAEAFLAFATELAETEDAAFWALGLDPEAEAVLEPLYRRITGY